LTSPAYDVVAIGNAIVDILSQSTDEFIAAEGMTKGSMALIFDPAAADDLYSRMGPGQEVSGGSGFCAQNQRRLHFGLGAAATVDTVTVRWPSGKITEIAAPATGRVHAIKEP
jgi:sugar/nucleoside kinase (ribokinase family)